MEVELQLTKEELKYLFSIIEKYTPQPLEDEVSLYQNTFNKVEHEMIADRIYDLLGDIECLEEHDGTHYEEWEDKLWKEDEDDNGFMLERNREMWTWDTVSKMEELVKQLEEQQDTP